MTTFGERFKSLRLEKKMGQEELINDFNKKYSFNFSKAAVSQYENGKRIPEIDALTSFADYFGVSIDYLLGKSDIRSQSEFNIPAGYLRVAREAREKGLTPEDIDMAIDFLIRARERDKEDKKD
jgi:transcriptional regulator with XRE-family HTH domain